MTRRENKFPWVTIYQPKGSERWLVATCKLGRRRVSRRLGLKRTNAEQYAARVSGWIDQWKSGVMELPRLMQLMNETKPVADWLTDYKKELVTAGRSPDYVGVVVPRARALLVAGEVRLVREFTAEAIQRGLDKLAADGREGRKLSDQTRRHYQQAAMQFANFLVRKKAIAESPLADMAGVAVETKVRRRRPPTDEEARILMAHVWASPLGAFNMPGPDRAMLYAFAMGTGYRAGELRSVRSDFIRDGVLAVPGLKTKNGDDAFQPLPEWLLVRFKAWWGDRPPGPLWPKFADRTSLTLQADLRNARAAWISAAGDDVAERARREKSDVLKYEVAGRFLDFHALRHCYISALVAMGAASIKEAQHLARHSSVELTVGLYSHAEAVKLRAVVERSIHDPMPAAAGITKESPTGTSPADAVALAQVVAQ